MTTTSQGTIQQDYMDEVVTDYAAAKAGVKKSFLGQMVGPAFVVGAAAAAATLAPLAVGASGPGIIADEGLNPSVIQGAGEAFPSVTQYFGTFARNSAIAGGLAAGIPATARKLDEMKKEDTTVQEKTA